jgi:hypothetical protein
MSSIRSTISTLSFISCTFPLSCAAAGAVLKFKTKTQRMEKNKPMNQKCGDKTEALIMGDFIK